MVRMGKDEERDSFEHFLICSRREKERKSKKAEGRKRKLREKRKSKRAK